jgi:hypothetical protein
MRTSLTHPLNVAYLVVGLVFLGISGSWALQAADLIDTGDVSWLLPAVLVAAGALGLVAMAAKGIRRRRDDLTASDLTASDLTASDLTASDLTASDRTASGLTMTDDTDGDPR